MTDAVQFIAANFGHPAEGPDAPRLRIEIVNLPDVTFARRERATRLSASSNFATMLGFRFSLPDPETDEVEKREKPAESPAVGKMPILSPPSVAQTIFRRGSGRSYGTGSPLTRNSGRHC